MSNAYPNRQDPQIAAIGDAAFTWSIFNSMPRRHPRLHCARTMRIATESHEPIKQRWITTS